MYESTDYGANWTKITGTTNGAVTGSPGYYYVKDGNPGLETGETVKYYTLRAYNGSESYISPVGSKIYLFKKDSFVQDNNLIPLPFDSYPDGIDNASDLGNSLTNCNQIVKWDNVNQKYSYCIKYGSNWYNDDFALTADGIYFMNFTSSSNETFDGLLNMTNFTLREGLNLIYIIDKNSELDDEDPVDGIDAQDLIDDIEAVNSTYITCSKVQQWDASSNSWNTHNDGDASPFSLNKLGAVFVTIEISEGGASSYPYKR
jgi:hypothetical protein